MADIRITRIFGKMQNYQLFLFIIFFASFLLSLFITFFSIRIAHGMSYYSNPNHRSSHTAPTPRIGGAGFALTFFLFSLIHQFYLFHDYYNVDSKSINDTSNFSVVFFVCGILSFTLGFLDDILQDFKTGIKFILQVMVAVIPAVMGYGLFEIKLPFYGIIILPAQLGYFLGAFWILSFMNIFNFMDGMNGKAGTFAITSFTFIIFILAYFGFDIPCIYEYLTVLIAGILGFLCFNFTPAKTFMGDCGSQLLGFMLAFIALALNQNSPEKYPFITFLLILLPFIFDSTLTIIKRLVRKENIFAAHREHLYQRLLKLGYSHESVLGIVLITYLFCGACGLGYMSEYDVIKISSFCAAALAMILYAFFVIEMENRAAKFTQGSEKNNPSE